MTAKQLIDEALDDQRKDVRERGDVVKSRLIGFYRWLKEERPIRSRGSEKHAPHVITGRGVADKTALTQVNAVRSFYGAYGIFVKLKGRERLPRARVRNRRLQLTAVDVKALVDHARTPRDRAMILAMFQSGMDVSTLCGLRYGDVAKGLGADEQPLRLSLFREKTGTEYTTFLGRDAVDAIKAYINDARASGVTFNHDTPLFVKTVFKRKGIARAPEPLEPHLVQKMLREVAVKSGLVDATMNAKDFNPVSPHALRESFGSIMLNKGVPDTIVDFWLGHEIGEMAEAYKRARLEELKHVYLEKEPFISVTTPAEVTKLKEEVEERSKQLQTLVNGLATENMELKGRMAKVELGLDDLKRMFERMLSESQKA